MKSADRSGGGRIGAWILVGLLVAALGGAQRARAQTDTAAASQPQAPGTAAQNLSELNEGIAAYLAEDYEEAARLLEHVILGEPRNAAALYFLGLINLEEGLAASRGARWDEAREAFSRARQSLESVVQLGDAGLKPIEAALDLGIAQLGGGGDLGPEGIKLSRSAAKTLEGYVESESGRTDRLGFFYLGVAYYRLSADDRTSMLRKASTSFDESAKLAAAEKQAGEIDQPEFERFNTIVTYYQGLIDVTRDQKRAARDKFTQVVERVGGTTLGNNAQGLIDYIDQQERDRPTKIRYGSPVGDLQFEGYLGLGAEFDTNVILLGKGTPLPRGYPKKDDYRYGLDFSMDVSRTFTERDLPLGRSLLIGIGGTTSDYWMGSIQQYDLNAYGGRAYINWEFLADWYLGLQYDYSYTMLGHNGFIASNRVSPVLSKIWRKQAGDGSGREDAGRSDFFYSYDYRNYLDEYYDRQFNRDGEYQAIGFRQTFNLLHARDIWRDYYSVDSDGKRRDRTDSERWFEMRFGYLYRDEKTVGTQFDLNGNGVYGELSLPMPWRLTFDFSGTFTWDSYWNPNLLDYEFKDRFDFIQTYYFALTRTLVDRGECNTLPSLQVRLRGGIETTFQDSNVQDRLYGEPYSYDRTIYGMRLMINF